MALRSAPHLWQAANGFWYVVWQSPKGPRRRSLRTQSKLEARQALREFQTSGAPRKQRSVSLIDAAWEWLADRARSERRLQPSTLNSYEVFVRQLDACAPETWLVDDVGPLDIRDLLDKFAEIYSPSPETQRKRLGMLSSIFRWLVRQELVRRNPCDAVEPPAARPQRKPTLSEAAYGALCEALDENVGTAGAEVARRNAEALRDLVVVLWHSGLRRVEALRLDWPDIDLQTATWLIRSPRNKGGDRAAPIHTALVPVLRRRKLLGELGPFQPRRPVENAWVSFKKCFPAWQGTDLHSLRHAFVTRLRRAGGADAAQFLAGHRTAAMTDLYKHYGAEEFREVLEML